MRRTFQNGSIQRVDFSAFVDESTRVSCDACHPHLCRGFGFAHTASLFIWVRVAGNGVLVWEKEPFGDQQELVTREKEPVAKEKELVGDQRVLLTLQREPIGD